MRTVLWLVSTLTAIAALGAEPSGWTVHSFKVNLVSRATMEVEGKRQGITADTEVRYSWRCKDQERSLIVDSVLLKVEEDGSEIMNTFMSRAKFVNVQRGKTNEIVAENAPNRLKTVLQESFGVPLCTLQVDEQGSEMKRSIIATPAAKDLVDNGMIINALLFHPPFPRGSREWSRETEMSMGKGGYAKGTLSYTKQVSAQSRHACNVSGTLTNERFKWPNSTVVIRNARYTVTGQQAFDSSLKEWVSGRLTINMAHQVEADEKLIGSARGTITATFERLPVSP